MMPQDVRTARNGSAGANMIEARIQVSSAGTAAGIQARAEDVQLSDAPGLRGTLSPELQRLEEIRVRVLDTTRAYLEADRNAN